MSPSPNTPADLSPDAIDAIERATLAAVAPEHIHTLPGWLLPMDSGSIGRAKSALPLWQNDASTDTLQQIAARYRSEGLQPAFRIADHPHHAVLAQALQALGFRPSKPTWVQVADTARLAANGSIADDALAGSTALSVQVDLDPRPDEAWSALFLGEGFDPLDGAQRVRSLSRANGSLYASARRNGQTLAAGAASFSHGWVSVHGMRTAAAQRRRGLAGQIIRTVAQEALSRGIERCFLQVEAHNSEAQSLYQRLGFQTVWRYCYWTAAAPTA